MNRLQKKCVVATAGIHLLLLLVLVFGSAFFSPRPKPDDTQLLDVISSTVAEKALSSGVLKATPPPPAPPVVTQPPPVPPPPTPKQVEPAPTITEKIKLIFRPEPAPEPVKPAPKKTENQPPKMQINTQLVSRLAPKNPTPNSKPDNSRVISLAIKNLQKNLSQGTIVNVPGTSSAAVSNYRDVLATIYYSAWVTPDGVANDEADTIVKIIVERDGTVVTSRITTRSGDAKVDDSVQRALDRVSSVPPLPDQSKSEQEFTIDFNLKTKRMLE